uniref:Uncharacterized protein n=1 Tax=Rhizophora mucronata TaxID=61149 RepID=A0A2P2P0S3_RHIMU
MPYPICFPYLPNFQLPHYMKIDNLCRKPIAHQIFPFYTFNYYHLQEDALTYHLFTLKV